MVSVASLLTGFSLPVGGSVSLFNLPFSEGLHLHEDNRASRIHLQPPSSPTASSPVNRGLSSLG